MKYVYYVLGILILTLGIALSIQSNLGTSPFDALLVGLSKNVGLTVGSWEIIIAVILIGCNALLRRDKPELSGLMTAFITGIGIDLWLYLLQNTIIPEIWYSRLVCFGIGLVVTGFGTAVYLQTHFAPIPLDRLTLVIQELARTNLFVSRTFLYIVFLLMALLVDGPIGIGTILTVCLGGLMLNYFMPLIKKFIDLSIPNHQDKFEAHQSIKDIK
ncbi:YczE/YyaS/YitT family protein [Ureibacillus sinduriensis]|uniref:YitT family protein n=1 Tax=Ureibacillus sinduriensis BLB-1 = JCM 15800 TaxID=1384057 RepID=A0A0A3IN96_9BACL|nr:YitT family protein [Ureibacillus sinduriensis]KGR76287.1 hypothetical protein CD33_07005 [Ureibacillus sinduriensis BLB-1 = JCM 15800]